VYCVVAEMFGFCCCGGIVSGVAFSTVGMVFCVSGMICRFCVWDRFCIFYLICFIIVFGVGVVGGVVFWVYFASYYVLFVFCKYSCSIVYCRWLMLSCGV
jgi:hypothetical protein